MGAVCFRVEGEALTDIARQRVIEDRFDHGYRILFEGLHGISSDQVLSILRGDSKLVGVNDVDMVPDDDQEWKAQLRYRFAGVWVTSQGRFMRPYAIVTSWGPDDMRHASDITPDSDSVKRTVNSFSRNDDEMAGRDLFYADDPRRDARKDLRVASGTSDQVARDRQGCVSILFREVRGFPMTLMTAHNDAQKALDVYLAAGLHLEERGYIQTFPREHFKVRYECETITDPAPLARTHPDINEASQTDFREIGRFRNKVIDARTRKMTLEEYEEYQRIMANRDGPLEQRMQALNKAMEIQRDLDRHIPAWRTDIVAQAGDDWIEMPFQDGTIRIPRAPFEQWCLWRTDGAHLAMPWKAVSPQGVKMFGDDPYHTDFLIGAGLEPDAMQADPALNDAIYSLRADIQKQKMGFDCAVLSGAGEAWGTIVHPKPGDEIADDAVVVVGTASARYLDIALKARAVIVERGGEMAHLVTVAREKEAIIVRMPDALKLYPAGSSVTVDASRGRIQLHEGDMKSIWDKTRP